MKLAVSTSWHSISFRLAALLLFANTAAAQPSLQKLIDETAAGGRVALGSGPYRGSVVLDKPVILDGRGEVALDGEGKGTLITIASDGAVVKNMLLVNSGDSHDRVDAAIRVNSSFNTIAGNRISNTLFGIDLQQAHNNRIVNNDISSKNVKLGIRGDGIRVWASHRNLFRKNKIHDSRDMVVWYSNDNLIEDNEGWNNRYSLHFMFAGGNRVRRNTYHHNTVGIFLMYSRDAVVERNSVSYSLGGTGVGIGLKESDNLTIQFNEIVYCSTGLYFDLSPFQPDQYNFVKANKIGFNITGVGFNSTLPRNIFKGNAFIGNLETVEVHANGTAAKSVWQGNFYDEYKGFDRDRNGYGDSPFYKRAYMDQLWMSDDWIRFFYGSPVIGMVNFLSRLAPITEPRLLFADHSPVFRSSEAVLLSDSNLSYAPPASGSARFAATEDEEEMDEESNVPARFAATEDEEEEEEEEETDDLTDRNSVDFNRYYLKQ